MNKLIIFPILFCLFAYCTRDLLTGKSNYCIVHKCKMEIGKLNIIYGLIEENEDYLKAMESDFPNSDQPVLGGCQRSIEIHAKVYLCPICIKNRNEWLKLPDHAQFNKE
jgi:hypothetical protein